MGEIWKQNCLTPEPTSLTATHVAALIGDGSYRQAHTAGPVSSPVPVSGFLGLCSWWDLLRRAVMGEQVEGGGCRGSQTISRNSTNVTVKSSLCCDYQKHFSESVETSLSLGGRAASPRPPDPYAFWGRREATPGQVGCRWGVGTWTLSGEAVTDSAEDTCILGTEQPLHDFLPIKKEVMGLNESWSRTAPVEAVTKGSNSSPSELSGMLTLPKSPECPHSCTRADPWGLALCSPPQPPHHPFFGHTKHTLLFLLGTLG